MTGKPASTDESAAAAAANVADVTEGSQELGNKPERLEWLQNAGFGMFIHWSVDSQLGSVISHTLAGSSEDYQRRFFEDLPKTFNPKRWDAEELASLAKLAGMKYIVFTTKHHCGFCMWDTDTTDFNIMNSRYGKDLLADYVQATREAGLAVGFYYSPEDFLFLRENGCTIRRLTKDAEGKPVGYSESLTGPVREKYEALVRAQCTELMTRYGPVDLIFFDGQIGQPAKETCWSLQPDILVTRGAIPTPEQTVPGLAPEGAWESCMTMGTQWAYKPTNEEYKSGTRVIDILIESRAKGGALLMNVGPRPDGAIPEPQEGRLREVGLWHFVNGEAIHNTRPWIVTNEGPIWFTKAADGDAVYAFITGIPDWSRGARKDFVLRSVKATDTTTIDVLGQSSELSEYQPGVDASSRFEQCDDGLHISVVRAQRLYNNSKWPNPVVVKLSNVSAALMPPAVETVAAERGVAAGSATFTGRLASLGDASELAVCFEYRRYAGFVEELHAADEWQATEDQRLTEPGEFSATVDGLETGTYQYRAVAKHPKLSMHGDHLRVSV